MVIDLLGLLFLGEFVLVIIDYFNRYYVEFYNVRESYRVFGESFYYVWIILIILKC